MRFRATVCYDGTEFFGFQRQANARSVQGEIEAALQRISDSTVLVIGAGRTDTGVHASGQVIAFQLDWTHTTEALTRAININLPDDVVVRDVAGCGEDFHPRFDAISRRYEYSVVISALRQPLKRRYAWVLEMPLDVARMNRAAAYLLGEHDFASFGTAPVGENTVRRVLQAEWQVVASEPLMRLKFVIEANAFLFRMVRRVVIALVQVGQGRLEPEQIREILHSRDLSQVKGLAPACGLNLVEVTY